MGKYYTRKAIPKPISTFSPFPVEFLDKVLTSKQNRYDNANLAQAKAFATLNEVDTIDEEQRAKRNELIDNLHRKYEDIDMRNHGDIGAASGEITNFIANSRKDPFWKLNEHSNKVYDTFVKEKAKLGPNALIKSAPMGAWDSKNGVYRDKADMEPDMMKKENWNAVVNQQIVTGIKSSSLNPEDQQIVKDWENGIVYKGIKPGKLNFVEYATAKGMTPERLQEIASDPNVVGAFLANAPSFSYAYTGADGYENVTADGDEDATNENIRNKASQYIMGVLESKANTNYNYGTMSDERRTGSSVVVNNIPKQTEQPAIVTSKADINNNVTKRLAYEVDNYVDANESVMAKSKAEQDRLLKNVLTDEELAIYNENLIKAGKAVGETKGLTNGTGTIISGVVNSLSNFITWNKKLKSTESKRIVKELEHFEPIFKELDSKINAYIFNGIGSIEGIIKYRDEQLSEENGFDANGNVGPFQEMAPTTKALIVTAKQVDEAYIKEAKASVDNLTKSHPTIYNAELKKTGGDKVKAYGNTLNHLRVYSKKLKAIKTNDYTYSDNGKFVDLTSTTVSTSLNDGLVHKNSYAVDSSGKRTEIGPDNKFDVKGLSKDKISVNYINGTLRFYVNDKKSDVQYYEIGLEDLKNSHGQLYQIVKAPHEIFYNMLDVSENGFGNFELGAPIVVGNSRIGAINSYNLKFVGFNKQGVIEKKITLIGEVNGKKKEISFTGTPAEITSKISGVFGRNYLRVNMAGLGNK